MGDIESQPLPWARTGIPATWEEAKQQAEAQSRQAQAEYFLAQRDGQLIDNRTAMALAVSAEIALEREQRKELWEGASNGRNRVYHFTDKVDPSSVDVAVDVLNRWQRIDADNDNPWRIVICSPGGDVLTGMKLYSTIKAINRYRPIITVASGLCASMATVLHQAGTTRLIEPGTSYMIHDISGEVGGNMSSMEDHMKWMSKLNHVLHVALAERSTLTAEEIATMSARKDSWFMPEEVVEMGFADAIGYATE